MVIYRNSLNQKGPLACEAEEVGWWQYSCREKVVEQSWKVGMGERHEGRGEWGDEMGESGAVGSTVHGV